MVLLAVAALPIAWWALVTPRITGDDVQMRLERGDVAGALAAAGRLVAARPGDGDAWLLLAACHEAGGDFDSAADAYAHAIPHARDRDAATSRRAMALLRAARLEEAEQVFRSIRSSRQDDEEALTELQWILFNQMRERELEELLESVLINDPGNFHALYHLLYSRQRPPNARECIGRLEEVDRLRPGQPAIEFALARCNWQLGDEQRARRLFDAARTARPRRLEWELVYAEFLFETGEFDEAASILAPPQDTEKQWLADDRWWWLQVRLLHRARDLSGALMHLETARRLRPGEAAYVELQAVLLEALGRRDDAAECRKDAIEFREADRALYIIVSRGDLQHPSPSLCREIAQACERLGQERQAEGWRMNAVALDEAG